MPDLGMRPVADASSRDGLPHSFAAEIATSAALKDQFHPPDAFIPRQRR
jgi:hypothetical protein